MAPTIINKKRKLEVRGKDSVSRPAKKSKKVNRKAQKAYHSSSDEESEDEGFTPVNLEDSDSEDHGGVTITKNSKKTKSKGVTRPTALSNDDSDSADAADMDSEASSALSEDDSVDSSSSSDAPSHQKKPKSKRNDPTAFATSMTKILSSKLSSAARADPLLSRSAAAKANSAAIIDAQLEAKARRRLREDKREALESGRVKNVLGEEGEVGQVMEMEKRLRKTAQRGVVKLFNAVRASQVKAEEARKEAREKMVGIKKRDEKVTEKSKEGFLEKIGKAAAE